MLWFAVEMVDVVEVEVVAAVVVVAVRVVCWRLLVVVGGSAV